MCLIDEPKLPFPELSHSNDDRRITYLMYMMQNPNNKSPWI